MNSYRNDVFGDMKCSLLSCIFQSQGQKSAYLKTFHVILPATNKLGGYTGVRRQSGGQTFQWFGLLVKCCVSNSLHNFQVIWRKPRQHLIFITCWCTWHTFLWGPAKVFKSYTPFPKCLHFLISWDKAEIEGNIHHNQC
mgnify:CR=1 FL=1